MKSGAKFVFAALLGATLWWVAASLMSPSGFMFNFDWPSETGGLTSKLMVQLLTFAVLSVPSMTAGCLILLQKDKKSRSMKKDKR